MHLNTYKLLWKLKNAFAWVVLLAAVCLACAGVAAFVRWYIAVIGAGE